MHHHEQPSTKDLCGRWPVRNNIYSMVRFRNPTRCPLEYYYRTVKKSQKLLHEVQQM